MKGIVFDIQNYAIYDGPGIRSLVFLKGCPLKCLWCHNPESQDSKPQISYFKERCVLCGNCVKACPNNALEIKDQEVLRNKDLCNTCATCVEACPNEVMELIGELKNSEEIVERVCRDKLFYENSGGGVTISGGEPTFQKEFLIELLSKLKEKGIHTAIETCGFFNNEMIDNLIDVVDLFLFDIKHINSELHKKYTGVPIDKILSNFQFILKKVGNNRIICRIPIIPGVNDDLDTIKGICNFLNDNSYTGSVHLMPYNKMAKTKYEKIGKPSLYKDMGDLTESRLLLIKKMFEQNSIGVKINE